MEDRLHMLAKTFSIFQENTQSPEVYTQSQKDNVEKFKSLTKSLYDSTWKDSRNFISTKPKSLPNLITKDFDEEQVWQQLELQNDYVLPSFLKKVSNISPSDMTFDIDITDSYLDTSSKTDGSGKNKSNFKTLNEYKEHYNKNEKYAFDDDSDSLSGQPSDYSESDEDESPRKKSETFPEEDYAFDDDSDSSMTELAKVSDKNNDYAFDDDSDSSMTELAKVSDKNDEDAFHNDSNSSMTELPNITGKNDEDAFHDDSNPSMTELPNVSGKNDEDAFHDDSDSPMTVLPKVSDKNTDLSENYKSVTSKKTHSTVVDDQFFKVSKLEQFLKLEDLKEEMGEQKDSDDEEVDLFKDIPSELDEDYSEDDEEEKTDKKSTRNLMYEDFFDPPESRDENVTEKGFLEGEENFEKSDDDYDHEDENMIEGDTKITENENFELKKTEKTAFEIEQEKVKKQIQDCERLLLKPAPWQFTGEVDARKRPTNSLMHQVIDFDSITKKDLAVDDTLTEKTENIIKMSIINQAWNDVERKVKTTEEMIDQKKKVVIEQTKSKKGLAEVYEDDYLKKKEKQKEEEDPKHQAIKKLMDNLFPELHALFSHIPKPPVPEIKIISNLPAVTVEDVAPVTMSDAHLLAPQEVKKRTGLIKSKTERTDTDRKRERRKKKKLQKMRKMEDEAKEKAGIKPLTARSRKKEKLEALKKLKKNKNTKIAEDKGQKIKSSKDFFSRLQDTVSSGASGNKKEKVSKKVKLRHK